MTYSDLVRSLRMHHYAEVPEVRVPAEFVVHGDTVTYWPVDASQAFRLHFFGDDLERSECRSGESWKACAAPEVPQANELPTEHGTVFPGQYIVHPHHGVGILDRLETRADADGIVRHFVSLLYAEGDKLLFPAERQAELMPYIGSRQPRLTRLYSKAWQKTKERVEKDLIAIARELLKIFAARQLTTRPPYTSGGDWVERMAHAAGFDLTEDQAKAMKEIELDLAGEHPMDRLVCGDVGFGKTEVALRAAARVLATGKQVAMIAPTTILVEQHFAMLEKRMSPLPVRVEHVSRLTGNKRTQIIQDLADGKVDCIVGTHSLLAKDVIFKDLGLLIVDEEQKFGVAQKERLKEMRPAIDVLSLSATPIPRTLSMSLSGLRSLSILRTPPKGRLPVETIIEPYADRLLSKAVLAALKSGGQAYVVHNRVQSLPTVRERLVGLLERSGIVSHFFEPGVVPEPRGPKTARLAIAHGQMDEVVLASTMAAFLAGEIDILLASSIVEHGLDAPGATVLAVLHSERFGLSDLYQLRGRVGRRLRQAQAYFFIGGVGDEGDTRSSAEIRQRLTEDSRRRLQALAEADRLGSGWTVALRDLEIRGGGNVLGHEQHGNMEAIGLLLYSQLLQEEIGRQARKMRIPLIQRPKVMEAAMAQ